MFCCCYSYNSQDVFDFFLSCSFCVWKRNLNSTENEVLEATGALKNQVTTKCMTRSCCFSGSLSPLACFLLVDIGQSGNFNILSEQRNVEINSAKGLNCTVKVQQVLPALLTVPSTWVLGKDEQLVLIYQPSKLLESG